MRRELNANRANTAARYNPGVETVPGQAHQHNFGAAKSVVASRPAPLFSVADYLAMIEELHSELFIHVERFGTIPLTRTPEENSKRRSRDVAFVHRWRHWGSSRRAAWRIAG